MTRWPVSLLLAVLIPPLAEAQAPDTIRRTSGVSVSGVVRDSIARAPLAGATVQIVAADSVGRFGRSAASDSLGRFTLGDVPTGRYILGFFHPMLDSLGVEAPLREVLVDGHQPVRADLAIPSAARLRTAICGPRSSADSGLAAVVVGVVRDARDGRPAAGVTVSGEWVELTFNRRGLTRRVPRHLVTTGANGWFAICNVPGPGTMGLLAGSGADSTDLIEVDMPAGGFLRRDLYLGPARTVATTDAPIHRLRTGDGSISGTVMTAEGAQWLAGAQVGFANGPQTRANERGEWALADVPTGTRMLEIRALGYYPARRRVDVIAGSAPVRVALFTLTAMLDTVRVKASRLPGELDRLGFEERRRTGSGFFLTAKDIERRKLTVLSDLFRNVPGIHFLQPKGLDGQFEMRGAFGRCVPTVYLNGLTLGIRPTSDDIDTFVRPEDVKGIEIYSDVAPPVQYRPEGGTALEPTHCGSIMIWTR